MTIRERQEQEELSRLSPYASFSSKSQGRDQPISPCELRTCYQRDRDRIIHCKSFRRLKYKTQVFLSPMGDHYRTRLTHTLEVSQVARTLARSLRLNEDLTEAMALGHDLGHTPFGHAGERALNRLYEGGFKHYEQSLRVVDVLERDGRGLNLCYETRMGILHHTHGDPNDTLEATTVRLADRIAYINHDLDDTIRAGILSADQVPEIIRVRCGERNSERINSIITDLIENSGNGVIKMSGYMQEAVDFFHEFMYSDVYTNPIAKGEESKVDGILAGIYDYYRKHPEKLPDELQTIAEREGADRAACDFVSGMTDGYAMEKYSELFIPMSWTVK